MAEVEKTNCPHGGAARHCTERADTLCLGRLVLLFGPRTTMPSRCEQVYMMVLGCNFDDAGRRERLKVLRRRATHRCNGPAHPTLACVCLGGAMQIDATPLLEYQTKLFVPIFRDVGVMLFCQPSTRHQSMSNVFSLVCCACTLSACPPLLAVRACHLLAHDNVQCNLLVFSNMPSANCLGVDI